jgi:hypothetical protein
MAVEFELLSVSPMDAEYELRLRLALRLSHHARLVSASLLSKKFLEKFVKTFSPD